MTGLLESVASLAGIGSAANDIRDFLVERKTLESILADLVEEKFIAHLPRLSHFCCDGEPGFDKPSFQTALERQRFSLVKADDLVQQILPTLADFVMMPGATCAESDLRPIYTNIAETSARAMWNQIAKFSAPSAAVMMMQNEAILLNQEATHKLVATNINGVEHLSRYAKQVHTKVFDKLEDAAPPSVHLIDSASYVNPFALARSEDFNHNYLKVATLFQDSPNWHSIQRRTENVFIEGGRGTGKSMLLRRLTAQASVEAKRRTQPGAKFSDLEQDYFGIYIKLTRGYYEQFKAIEGSNPTSASLLAQHELNIEILDSFIETLVWLNREDAILAPKDHWRALGADLAGLFPNAPQDCGLDELQHKSLRFEQNEIIEYCRDRAFGKAGDYRGSAQETVQFLRRLSHIFRKHLFPNREVRLFLLLDEFETLLETQQIAVNTVMKMRLPDISTKVAVRRDGRKTSATFTPGDPIQDPRDYTPIFVDYDVGDGKYKELLHGIASKRLEEAGYENTDIKDYLRPPGQAEVDAAALEAELQQFWASGNRRSDAPNEEFTKKYTTAAVYRTLARNGRRKSFAGFDQFVLLSSGIVSNYIELCKYAFYFALNDGLMLIQRPEIPEFLQNEAAYRVSQRLLETVEGNVPRIGGVAHQLLVDLGAILRERLLHHPSEPEANRISITNLNEVSVHSNPPIHEVLDGAITWSVLHMEQAGTAFRSKNPGFPPEAEMIINRIYCPALGISPRSRWRVTMPASDLSGLINPLTRVATFKKLNRRIGGEVGMQASLLDPPKDGMRSK